MRAGGECVNLFVVVALAIFLGWMQKYFYRKYWKQGLSAQVSFAKDAVYAGEEVQLTEQLDNRKWLPISKLHLKYATDASFQFHKKDNVIVTDQCYRNDVFTLFMHQTILRNHTFTCQKRGYYTIPVLELIASDLFLEEVYAEKIKNHCALYVYPKLLALRELPSGLLQQMGELLTEQSLFRDDYAFQGIREYRAGDSMRHVNWKRTAAGREILVNTYQPCCNQDVTIILNMGVYTPSTKDIVGEYLIRLAATLCTHFLKEGSNVSLKTNGADIVTGERMHFQEMQGGVKVEHYYRGLARLNAKAECACSVEELVAECERSGANTCYLFLSNEAAPNVQAQYARLKRKGARALWILPEYKQMQAGVRDAAVIRMEVPEHE